MILDITGTMLVPGNLGRDCPGNGEDGQAECCCDECDYMLCCTDLWKVADCEVCGDAACPRKNHKNMGKCP